jgi:cell division septum initiation protein DivIVA
MYAIPLILVVLLAQASPSIGDPQVKAQAKALLGQGTKLYEQGDVAGALEKFQAAYASFPSPKLMFNIGQANRDLHRHLEALEAFEKFLADAPDASPEMIADARKSVHELHKKLGQIQIDCMTSGSEVSVDGRSVGWTPLPGLIWATSGHHQITAKHEGVAPAVEKVDVKAGVVSNVNLRLAATVAAASVSAPTAAPALDLQSSPTPGGASEGWWLGRKWTWVAGGSTVLLAVGAITAGLSMQSKFNSLNSSCGRASPTQSQCSQSDVDSVSSRQTVANVFWGLAAAGAVTTGVLFYFEGQPVTVAPIAGATTGAMARVGF